MLLSTCSWLWRHVATTSASVGDVAASAGALLSSSRGASSLLSAGEERQWLDTCLPSYVCCTLEYSGFACSGLRTVLKSVTIFLKSSCFWRCSHEGNANEKLVDIPSSCRNWWCASESTSPQPSTEKPQECSARQMVQKWIFESFHLSVGMWIAHRGRVAGWYSTLMSKLMVLDRCEGCTIVWMVFSGNLKI